MQDDVIAALEHALTCPGLGSCNAALIRQHIADLRAQQAVAQFVASPEPLGAEFEQVWAGRELELYEIDRTEPAS